MSPARLTLSYGSAGLSFAAIMVLLKGEGPILLRSPVWIGGVAAVLAAFCFGAVFTGWYRRRGVGAAMALGCISAFGTLMVGVVAGSMPGLLAHAPDEHGGQVGDGLSDWLGKPVFWGMVFGAGPALVMGIVCGIHAHQLEHELVQGDNIKLAVQQAAATDERRSSARG